MKLVMTLLVRDEEDIVAANIEYHLDRGVDFVVVTDNRSVDATPEILAGYVAQGVARVIVETDDDYRQRDWVTRMARLAAVEHGADWVINADADEFWWPSTATLTEAMAEVGDDFGAVSADRHNYPPSRREDGLFADRMVLRDQRSSNSVGRPLPPKVCHRGRPDVVVGQGNHRAQVPGAVLAPEHSPITILHFPLRTYAQFERKIVSGGRAYERNPAPVGRTWRMLYRMQQTGRLRAHFDAEVVDVEDLSDPVVAGRYVVDTRLREHLRARGIPGGRSPTGTPGAPGAAV